jgi:hypothetical protein
MFEGRAELFRACAEGVREELRIGNWGSGVLGMVKTVVSELRRRCKEMRFLLAAGVFELATISAETVRLLFKKAYLVREGMCMPLLVKSGGAGAGVVSRSSSESQ